MLSASKFGGDIKNSKKFVFSVDKSGHSDYL